MTVAADRRARAFTLWAQRWTLDEIAASADVTGGRRATLYRNADDAHEAIAAERRHRGRGRLLDERDRDLATLDELLGPNIAAARTGDAQATRNVTALVKQRAELGGYRAQDDPERLIERHDDAVAEQLTADALDALDAIGATDAQRATFRAHLAWSDARRRTLAGAPRGTRYDVPPPPTLTPTTPAPAPAPERAPSAAEQLAAYAVPGNAPAAA